VKSEVDRACIQGTALGSAVFKVYGY